mmetsp:Transcript_2915/g.8183  ORF Transcript_2915/g.8183 Transcript_2915/m.8183 type:complete len:266 (-) Transcript_2915:110-907(-)
MPCDAAAATVIGTDATVVGMAGATAGFDAVCFGDVLADLALPLALLVGLAAPLAPTFFPVALVFSSPDESSSPRISGASSRSACPDFLIAFWSPMSNQSPVSLSSFRKRPGGSMLRISRTILAAMWAFSSFSVDLARYIFFRDCTISRNWMFPACELILPPRPHSTSLMLGSTIGPMPRGGTTISGRGLAVDFLPPALVGGGAPAAFELLVHSDCTTTAAAWRRWRLREYFSVTVKWGVLDGPNGRRTIVRCCMAWRRGCVKEQE